MTKPSLTIFLPDEMTKPPLTIFLPDEMTKPPLARPVPPHRDFDAQRGLFDKLRIRFRLIPFFGEDLLHAVGRRGATFAARFVLVQLGGHGASVEHDVRLDAVEGEQEDLKFLP